MLLPSDADAGIWEHFATATIPVPEQVQRVLAVLDRTEPMSVVAVEAQSGVRRGRVELMLKQLAVDEVVQRVEGGWLATGKEWTYDAAHYDGVVAVRRREADIMRAYTRGEGCLMELLQRSLDDPDAGPCGRCSVCRGELPEGLEAAPARETVTAVARVLRSEVHLVEPRKMWPGGAFGARGRIAPDELAAQGRALVHADAPEWREVVAAMFARDAAAPQEVLEACVEPDGGVAGRAGRRAPTWWSTCRRPGSRCSPARSPTTSPRSAGWSGPGSDVPRSPPSSCAR